MCKHLMTPPYIETLVDDPITASNVSLPNLSLNHLLDTGKLKLLHSGSKTIGRSTMGRRKLLIRDV